MTKTITVKDGDNPVGSIRVSQNNITTESLPNSQLKEQITAQDGLTTYRGVEPVDSDSDASHSDKRDPVTEDELVGYLSVLIQRAGFNSSVA